MTENSKNNRNYSIGQYAKFLIPSIIGIIIFMLPVKEYDPDIKNDKVTIPIAYLASFIQKHIGEWLPTLIVLVLVVSAVGAILYKFGLIKTRSQYIKGLLDRKSTRLNSSHANISYA